MLWVINRWRLWLVLGVLLVALLPAVTARAAGLDNESLQCIQCHGNEKFEVENNGTIYSLFIDREKYLGSAHGDHSCLTCHSEEAQIPHPEVVYGRELENRVSQNCEACHAAAKQENPGGVHATVGPTCLDCHGSGHEIKRKGEGGLSKRDSVEICVQCHQGEIITSYDESFHGKAVNLGSTLAASCVDCHGSHQIKGADDPRSPVAAGNVAETCANCHGVAASGFAQGREHFKLVPEGDGKPMYYTYKFFTWLTIIVITLLIIHIELELLHKLRSGSH